MVNRWMKRIYIKYFHCNYCCKYHYYCCCWCFYSYCCCNNNNYYDCYYYYNIFIFVVIIVDVIIIIIFVNYVSFLFLFLFLLIINIMLYKLLYCVTIPHSQYLHGVAIVVWTMTLQSEGSIFFYFLWMMPVCLQAIVQLRINR